MRRGFTLIELMIVLVVVAVLAAIALPSYSRYLQRSARAAAQSLMLDLAGREAQYLLDQRVYAADTAGTGTLGYSGYPADVTGYYTITITTTAGPPPTYTIHAKPKTGTIVASDPELTLDQAGVKSPADKWTGR